MQFAFPEIKTNRTEQEQAQKVVDEVNEYLEDLSDEEAVDILHAAETFIRVKFRGRMGLLDFLIEQATKKNEARGYYTKTCF